MDFNSIPFDTTPSVTEVTKVSIILTLFEKDGSSDSTNFMEYFPASSSQVGGRCSIKSSEIEIFHRRYFLFPSQGISLCIDSIFFQYIWYG